MGHKKTDPRRHLVPAMYSWICENFSRVFITAVVSHPNIRVPINISKNKVRCDIDVMNEKGEESRSSAYVEIVTLNFGIEAISGFYNDENGFHAKMRFNGIPFDIYLPFDSIIAIYSPDDHAKSAVMAFSLYHGQENLTCGEGNKSVQENRKLAAVRQPDTVTSEQIDTGAENSGRKNRPNLRIVH